MKPLTAAFLLCWFFAPVAFAQEAEELHIPFTNPDYEIGDWISYTSLRFVNAVAVGPREIYFATTGGIARYDHFRDEWERPWTISDGLPASDVTAVAYDADTDIVWCATDVGVSYRNPTSCRWTNFYGDDFGAVPGDPVLSIGVSPHGVYFESADGRRAMADKFGNNVTDLPDLFPQEEIFWFGARASQANDYPMFHMSQGWIFDPEGYICDFRLRSYPVTCSQADAWSELWLGTWGVGVAKADLRMARLEMLPTGLWSREVRTLAEDGERLWIAGFGGDENERGITVWNRTRREWEYYQARYTPNLPSDRVLSAAVQGDRVWLATDIGLVLFSASDRTWRLFDSPRFLDDTWVWDVLADSDWVWVATRRGVSKLRLGKGKKDTVAAERLDPVNLRGMEIYDLEKSANLLWLGTSGGLYVYDLLEGEGGFVREENGPAGSPVTAVCARRDTLWLGNWNGIEALDMSRRMWLPPPAGRYEINSQIHMIRADEKAVWVATDAGVYKYDRQRRRWRRFTVRDGLVGSKVYCILLDGDYVWFGTNRGLTRFYWNSPYRID